MKALITGASSGIGKEIAVILGNLGYDIYAVARRGDKLNKLKEYGVSVFIGVPLLIESMYKKIMKEVEKQNKVKLINTITGCYYNIRLMTVS